MIAEPVLGTSHYCMLLAMTRDNLTVSGITAAIRSDCHAFSSPKIAETGPEFHCNQWGYCQINIVKSVIFSSFFNITKAARIGTLLNIHRLMQLFACKSSCFLINKTSPSNWRFIIWVVSFSLKNSWRLEGDEGHEKSLGRRGKTFPEIL